MGQAWWIGSKAIIIKNKHDETADTTHMYTVIIKNILLRDTDLRRTNKGVKREKLELMALKPINGVLGVLDIIFDYLTIDELNKYGQVNKFFLMVAQMDKLLEKFSKKSEHSK